ncbi:hypothetical protein BC941DRAFT_475999 [Chlamydoabsidia padenii]|nr:hypothetical protein BC941DRAFT_475999 [Chlamydoabsidia padenii]
MLDPHPAETIVAFEVAYQKFENFNNQSNDIWIHTHTVATGKSGKYKCKYFGSLYNQIDELNKEKRQSYWRRPRSKKYGKCCFHGLWSSLFDTVARKQVFFLLQELENDNEKAKRLMKFHTLKINASNINCKSRSTFYRHQLQHKKDENKKERQGSDGVDTSIYVLESSISETAKLSIEDKHNVEKHCKDDLVRFYNESNRKPMNTYLQNCAAFVIHVYNTKERPTKKSTSASYTVPTQIASTTNSNNISNNNN